MFGTRGAKRKAAAAAAGAAAGDDREARRAAALKRAVGSLNAQFFAWVSAQQRGADTAHDSWEAGCRDYMRYMRELRAEYADVALEAKAPVDGVAGAADEGAGVKIGAEGQAMTFGTGDFGILGLGDDVDESYLPRTVGALAEVGVTQMVCGGMHTLALTSAGVVYSWGINDEGALGRVANKDVEGSEETPGEVPIASGSTVLKVTAGDSHSIALCADGCVYGWGTYRNSSGPMGFVPGTKVAKAPIVIAGPKASPATDRVVDVASGADHVLALTAGGEVLSWGCPEKGRLGRVSQADSDTQDKDQVKGLLPVTLTPTVVPLGGRRPTAIAAGAFCSFVVCGEDVLAFGLNNYSQLGIELGDGKGVQQEGREKYEPVRVDALSGKGVCTLHGGEHHTLAVTSQGQVLAMGRPTYGRLGRTDVDPESDDPVWAPGVVPGIDGVVAVACGLSTSAAISRDGRCWTWGSNTSMQLGKPKSAPNADDDEITPYQVKGGKRMAGKRVTCVSFGGQHSALVAVDGAAAADGAARKRARA